MKKNIYLISPTKISGNKFYRKLDLVLKTGMVKFFQLRLKKTKKEDLLKISRKIKKITKKNNVKFLINDKPLIAKKVRADGCHIGQKDMDCKKTREILGNNKIIGVTCHNSKRLAVKAKNDGADYIAFGSFFESLTKKSKSRATLATLHWAKKKINMPIVAIGGIDSSNYKKITLKGADFIACSNYVWNNKKLNPVLAIKNLK